MCVCASHMCLDLWRSDKLLWVLLWALWSEPWSSGKTTNILIQWAIFPAPKESVWTAYTYPTTHWCSIHGHTPNIRHLILCWTICFTVCVSSLIFLHALTNLLLIFNYFFGGVGVFIFLSLENFSQAPLQGCCLHSPSSAPPLKPWSITVTTILMSLSINCIISCSAVTAFFCPSLLCVIVFCFFSCQLIFYFKINIMNVIWFDFYFHCCKYPCLKMKLFRKNLLVAHFWNFQIEMTVTWA